VGGDDAGDVRSVLPAVPKVARVLPHEADALVNGARGRLARLLEAAPLPIVEPAVVDATQPAVLDAAVAEVGPAVGAVKADPARPSSIVSE
jgi:hypothetical protein